MSDSVTLYYNTHVRQKLRDFVEGNDRVERAWQSIEEWAPVGPSHILEIGCGIGAVCWRMSRKWPTAKVIGLDLSPRSIQVARKLFGSERVSFIEAVSDEVCGNYKADLIILMDVYEHISTDERPALHRRLKESRCEYGRIFLSFPTPRHLAWLRKYKPDAIQPVDEDIDFETISALARDSGTEILVYKEVNVWQEGDYAHAVLGRRAVWRSPVEGAVSSMGSDTPIRPGEPLLPPKPERARMVYVKVGNEFVQASHHSGLATDSSYVNPQWSVGSLDTVIVRRAILNALRTVVPKLSGLVLDIGCGHKPYKSLILAEARGVRNYLGLDVVNNVYGKPDLQWDEKQMPLKDESVDCALATEVLEHCRKPEIILRETFRVLKPGGLLFLTVPFLWPLHDTPHDEYRYTPFALERLLRDAGFDDIKLHPLGGWDASMAQLIGLWVRRRPMSAKKRKYLSKLALPLIKFLLKRDRLPTEFVSNCMITGLSGSARKIGR